jgi:DNA-directed RNA polymerase subunit RPC12/RpoP
VKVFLYACPRCFDWFEFKEDSKEEEHCCPSCHIPLEYMKTCEMDDNTNKVINSYQESARKTPGTNYSRQTYTPKCPTCGSPDVEKISLTSKVFGGALFGLFSSDVRKTMRCNSCGYKW